MKNEKGRKDEDTDEGLDLVPWGRGGGAPVGTAKARLEAEGIPSSIVNEFAARLSVAGMDGAYLLIPRKHAERAYQILTKLEEEILQAEQTVSCLDCDSTAVVEAKMTLWERLTVQLNGKVLLCRSCGYRWKR